MERVLLNWSGGIDSTALLFDLLEQDYYIYLHHNVLKNCTQRYINESAAVSKILTYLKKIGYNNYTYIETVYEQPDHLCVPYDCYLHLGYISGVICKTYDLSKIFHPITRNDLELSGTGLIDRAEESLSICKIVAGNTAITYTTPYITLSKDLVYKRIPEEVRGFVWCCRKPVRGYRCGTCTSCIDQSSLLIKDKK